MRTRADATFWSAAALSSLIISISHSAALATPPSTSRTLTFDERVAAQRAIEGVYWSHRIWPDVNPAPKPPLQASVSDETLRDAVARYLKLSNALELVWNRPVTGHELQSEMERMAASTRSPGVLHELFQVLDDDPRLIAETLARPRLVERLARSRYAWDERFHGALRKRIERALAGTAGAGAVALREHGAEFRELRWVLDESLDSKHVSPDQPHQDLADPILISVSEHEWEDVIGRFAGLQPRVRSVLREEHDRFEVIEILEKAEAELTVAMAVWPKTSFEAWWDGQQNELPTTVDEPVANHSLPAVQDVPCTEDTWRPTSIGPDVPTGRRSHTAVWTGAEMIVWGGLPPSASLNTGGRYDPATDDWRPTSTGANVPSGRHYHTAIWTGTEMIVWGGTDFATNYNTGGSYEPASDTWSSTSIGMDVPSGRYVHTAVWTGTEMIVWGGLAGASLNTGGRYDPDTDTWKPTSTGVDTPGRRWWHGAVWTGTEMIVWGGQEQSPDGILHDTGGRYDPTTDSWRPTSTGVDVPSGRSIHSLVWTGTEMIVWGGYVDVDPYAVPTNTGGRYDPATDSWRPTSTGVDVPSARYVHTAVWAGTEMIVWGGDKGTNDDFLPTGGRYDPVTDLWRPTSTGANVPSGRRAATAVWTGAEVILWGGYEGGPSYANTGGLYCVAPCTPSAEICDGIDNDCNGYVPMDELDADGDGFRVCDGDCAPESADAWAVPAEVSELSLAHDAGPGGWTTLSWSAPAGLGGLAVTYDVIRSSSPFGFSNPDASSCVEADDGGDMAAVDVVSPEPGCIAYFLVVAENPCGQGELGTTSDGLPRTARECP